MKEGQYFYRPHRRMWRVMQNHNHPSGVSVGKFVKDFPTKDEAASFVYKMNGWDKKPN